MRNRIFRNSLIIALFLALIFLLTPFLLIQQAKSWIDDGIQADHTPPRESFYKGISLLQSATWFPYFGHQAEELITAHMANVYADYWIDYSSYSQKYYNALVDQKHHAFDSTLALTGMYKTNAANFEYPEMNMDTSLNTTDRAVFCERWARFEKQMADIKSFDSTLLDAIQQPLANCN